MKKKAQPDVGLLMAKYLDGRVSKKEVQQLNHALVDDPKQCRKAARALVAEAMLREDGRRWREGKGSELRNCK